MTWSTSYEILKKCKAKLANVFPSVAECCVCSWDTFLEESMETIPWYHCWGWESSPPSPLPTNTAYGPLEFSSVTARYPELTVSTSHPICHVHYAQGRSPPYPTGKAVPQSSWKCSEIDPAAGKTRRRCGLLWCLPIPNGIIRFLKHIGARTLPDRQVWEEWVGTFYGSRKNRVSQPFWLLQHIFLLYWWCFVFSPCLFKC